MKHLSRCLFAAGAEAFYLCTADAIVLRHENDLGLIPSVLSKDRTNLMTIHLFSTCPMGEDQKVCVADSFGRVHGEKRLWIADASLLPGSPSLNPQGTVMGIVRRNMAEFLGKS